MHVIAGIIDLVDTDLNSLWPSMHIYIATYILTVKTIMPKLCLKLAYYAGIMLDALACLVCLKLCWHNRPMAKGRIMKHAFTEE